MAKFTKEKIKLKDQTNRLIKKNKYKGCIWGLYQTIENNCSPDIIAAHSIQRGMILSNIAEDGKIYCFAIDNISDTLKVSFQLEGIKKFSTIKAFCGKHDKDIFKEIEDKPFKATPLQMDLYAYRAVSKILYSNLSSKNTYDELIQEGQFSPDNDPNFTHQNTFLNIKDFIKICFHIQDVITKNKPRHYEHIYCTLNKEYPIACSSSFPLYYDLDGKELFCEKEKRKFISNRNFNAYPNVVILNIFPNGNKTHIIFSVFNSNVKVKSILKELISTDENNIKQQLSNFIINYIENVAFRPSYINNFFTNEEKDKICKLFTSNNLDNNLPIKDSINLFRE